jgi:hypothetical protein
MEDAAHEEAADGYKRLYLEAGEVMEDAAHEEAADGHQRPTLRLGK